MRWLLWLIVGLLVVVAALPFVVLSAMGVMRPTEGFCVESMVARGWNGLPNPPTAEEQEQSFFVSPELADPTLRVPLGAIFGTAGDDVNWRWPVCLKTRRAEHQILKGHSNWQLTKLGEPKLRNTVRTGAVYRVLTAPSFSRVPIAFRLEVDAASGEGTLNSTWLEEDGSKPNLSNMTAEAHRAWWNATLPRHSLQRRLGAQQTKALQVLFDDLPPYEPFGIDGIRLVIEAVHDGRRDVRLAFLYPPPDPTGRIFCAMANQSGLPKKVLVDGHVDMCGD